jgi:hypothetical protein
MLTVPSHDLRTCVYVRNVHEKLDFEGGKSIVTNAPAKPLGQEALSRARSYEDLLEEIQDLKGEVGYLRQVLADYKRRYG